MKHVKLGIYFIPPHTNISMLDGYDAAKIGKTLSTPETISVNKVGTDEYTVVYLSTIFEMLDPSIIGKNIISILTKNLKNSNIDIQIFYCYEEINLDEDKFTKEAGEGVIRLHNYLFRLLNPKFNGKEIQMINNNVVHYNVSQSMIETADYLRDLLEDDDEDEDEETEETNDDEDEDVDPVDSLNEIMKYYPDAGYDDDDDDEDSPKRKYKKKEYGTSRVMRAAKNPKRAYRRHGVLVCKDKGAIKKDEKIIKAFLKDFFPGDSEWKKKFRKDVLKRWMSMYVVTSNRLKQLEKEHRKQVKKKHYKSINTDKAMEMTRRLLNVPIDRWSDPSK